MGTFTGNIVNSGAITAGYEAGLYIDDVGYAKFAGSITNSGAISAPGYSGYGIEIEAVADWRHVHRQHHQQRRDLGL